MAEALAKLLFGSFLQPFDLQRNYFSDNDDPSYQHYPIYNRQNLNNWQINKFNTPAAGVHYVPLQPEMPENFRRDLENKWMIQKATTNQESIRAGQLSIANRLTPKTRAVENGRHGERLFIQSPYSPHVNQKTIFDIAR